MGKNSRRKKGKKNAQKEQKAEAFGKMFCKPFFYKILLSVFIFFCSFLQVTAEENVVAQENQEKKKSLPPVWISPQQRQYQEEKKTRKQATNNNQKK